MGVGPSRYSDRLEKPANLLKNRHQLGGSTSMNTAVRGSHRRSCINSGRVAIRMCLFILASIARYKT
jgi:hypothetical protein